MDHATETKFTKIGDDMISAAGKVNCSKSVYKEGLEQIRDLLDSYIEAAEEELASEEELEQRPEE